MSSTVGPEQVVDRLGPRPGVIWLDSGLGADGWSVVAFDPVEVCTDAADWPAAGRALGRPAPPSELPFVAGVLGYVGFGAGATVAPVPAGGPTPEPPVWLGRFEGALCFRHADQTWHPTGTARAVADSLLAPGAPLPSPPPPTGRRPRTEAQEAFEAGVRQILELIRAGDCYQVNLTRPVWIPDVGAPWPAYRRLRQADARYGAYLQLTDDLAVLSNSPELLLEVAEGHARSCPIKGTRPRSADPAHDGALAAELYDAPKDRAELTMIVDLVRNDLSRVCTVGSVWTGPRTVSTHPTLHHAVQEVGGRLRPEVGPWAALAALFPPGSVTGAPKIRACQRIAELESHPRGVYCGAIGGVCDSGRALFNVAIRTAVIAEGTGRYHVGGGIVAASDPTDEWLETEVKARALARALDAPSRV